MPKTAEAITPADPCLAEDPEESLEAMAVEVVLNVGRFDALLSLSQLGSALHPMPEHVRSAGKHLLFVQLAQVEDDGSRHCKTQLLLPQLPRFTQHVEQPEEKPSPSTHFWKHDVPLEGKYSCSGS